METIAVKCIIDRKTYFRVCLRILYSIKLLSIVFGFLALWTAVLLFTNSFDWISEAWLIGFVVAYLVIITPAILWIGTKRAMKKVPMLAENITYYVNDQSIDSVTENTSNKITWKYIDKAIERNTYFILCTSPRMFRYFPKKGFVSAQDIELFRNMVKANAVKANF